eukprot:4797837-Prymnesium_polylepis.2
MPDIHCPSRVAPSPLDINSRSIELTTTGSPATGSTAPGGRYTFSAATCLDRASWIAELIWLTDPTVT